MSHSSWQSMTRRFISLYISFNSRSYQIELFHVFWDENMATKIKGQADVGGNLVFESWKMNVFFLACFEVHA